MVVKSTYKATTLNTFQSEIMNTDPKVFVPSLETSEWIDSGIGSNSFKFRMIGTRSR